MKKIFLVLMVAMFFAGHAHAEDQCAIVAETARVVMELRQLGATLKEVLDAAKIDNEGKELKFLKMVAVEAWKEPYWNSNDLKRKATNEFESKWYRMCIEQSSE